MICSLLAGFTDVACLRTFASFSNKFTGHTVQSAATFAMCRWADAIFNASLLCAYVAGVAVFRVTDRKRNDDCTTTALALPVCLLFVSADAILRCASISSRLALVLLAAGCGTINGASVDKTGTITSMVTGHLQKLGSHLADCITQITPPTAAQSRAAWMSVRVIGLFLTGVASATLALSGAAPISALQTHRPFPIFSILGAAYASLLVAHDRCFK